jgi:hypothetical protein
VAALLEESEVGGGDITLQRSTPAMARSSADMAGTASDEASHSARGSRCKARRRWKAASAAALIWKACSDQFIRGGAMNTELSQSVKTKARQDRAVDSTGVYLLPQGRGPKPI